MLKRIADRSSAVPGLVLQAMVPRQTTRFACASHPIILSLEEAAAMLLRLLKHL